MAEKKSPKISRKDSEAAKPSKETVYVDVDDEITTIIDKVEAAKEKIVALVLPKRASVLQSTVNMRLLKRAADKAAKSVVLITSDAALLPLAGIVGLHAAKNLQSKPVIPKAPDGKDAKTDGGAEDLDAITDEHATKLDYHRSIGELAAASMVLGDDEAIDLDEEPDESAPKKSKKATPKDKKLKVPDFDRFRLKMILIAGAGVLLLVFLVLAIFVLPKATITVKTTSVPATAEFTVTASDQVPALDQNSMAMPAASKTSEQTVSQSVKATGQQNQGEKAEGTVKLANCTATARTIPAGTGVSSSGLVFITQKSVSLDEGNFTLMGACQSNGDHIANVDVVAQTGGAKYNIGPSSFTVSGFSGVTGSSSSAMTGGTDNIITTLTQADVDKVKQQITAESSDAFSKTFTDQLANEGHYVVASTLKLSDAVTSSTPSVGQPASTANVTAKVKYSVLVVNKDDLKKIVTDQLNKNLDKSKQKLSTEDVLAGLTVDVKEQSAPGVAVLSVSQTTTAVPIIDEDSIRKQAAGQKTSTIKASLSGVGGVEEVEVKLSPFWVSKAPKASKITVVQQELKENQTNETP